MRMSIKHELAMAALEAGIKRAKELDQRSCLSIVDAGGHLVGFIRVEDAAFGTIEVATNKAYTAAALRKSTDTWMAITQPGQELYGLERSCARPFVVFGGGLPVTVNGEVVGGVGVSGGPEEADVEIAKAMVAVLQAQ
ncbi:heme-binding protein [Pseudomonas mosselii]|uniref:Heme-binding protein n=2 Tax=Pseudomonas TaxID=286 RepID=A0A5R8ZJD8_9PSED|nr:heme-binding protein [Pseudomonas mosselii]